MFSPRLDILPEPQRLFWPELGSTPVDFILYGGTAIALRLGHRTSVDFGFFSFEPFVPRSLLAAIPYLRGSVVLQSAENTLTCRVDRGGPVQLSYFGGLSIGQVAAPESVLGPAFPVAMPIDLGGTKVALVMQRAEAKDYVDVHALLGAGTSSPEMLGAALVIYGNTFSPLLALKALAYHEEPELARLPKGLRGDLAAAVKAVDLSRLPSITPVRPRVEKP